MPNSAGVEVARISVKVSPNTKDFRRELKRDLEAIERAMRAEIGVDADTRGFRQQVRAATTGLKATVEVDADISTLKSQLAELSRNAGRITTSGLGAGMAGSEGALRGGPAMWAALAAAALAASPLIAGAVGAISTAFVSLPGIIAAAAVPLGALALGTDGLKKAAEGLRQPFEDLKTTVSDAAFKAFGPVFESLKPVFGALERSMPTVVEGMAKIGTSVADVFTSSNGLHLFENSIDNIAKAIEKSAPGIQTFAAGLLQLVENFTGKLPDLAGWINDTGNSFFAWVQDFTRVGPEGTSKFDRAMQGLGETLQIVGGVLTDIGKESLDFFSNPEKMKTFKDELTGIATAAKELYGALVGISSVYSTISPKAGEGLQGLLPFQFQGVLELVEKIRSIDWSGVWDGMKTATSTAWQVATQTVQSAIGTIQGVVAGVGTVISGVWSGIQAEAQTAWNGVVTAVQTAWNSITSAVQTGISTVVGFVQGMGSQIIGAITSIDLAGAGRALMDGLLGGIKAGAQAVFDFVSGIAGKIAELKGPISYDKVVLIPNGEALMEGLNKGLDSGFQSVKDTVSGMAGQLSDEFQSGLDFSLDSGFSTDSENPLVKAGTDLMNVPIDFARATGQQFMSDLGISGEGFIPKAITEGAKYIFQIGSVDEALSIKDREETKQAMSITGGRA